jgi:phosphatidylserine/phosphatidylglycerophosphate/cardiolipin synthase-like enzyme
MPFVRALIFMTLASAYSDNKVDVFFSPGGGCTTAIISQIRTATNSIQIQAYSFTSAPIAKALVDAHTRGIQVFVVLDRLQQSDKYSAARFLKNNGIPVFIDSEHNAAHNKVMIIDRSTVITGSFNFTKAAEEKNAENLLILGDQRLATKYLENFIAHMKHSTPVVEAGTITPSTSKR